MMESNIIEKLYEKLKSNEQWFTTDLDPVWGGNRDRFELDQYGELTEKETKKVIKEIENYIGDGAGNLDEAIELFIENAYADELIGCTCSLHKHFEEKPIVPGLEATEVIINKPNSASEGVLNELTESVEEKEVDVKEEIVEEEPDKEEKKEIKSVEQRITDRTQDVYNKLVDAGYTVDISTDNGNSELAVEIENGQILVNINDPDAKLVPVTSGSIVLNDKNEEQINNIKKIIINESKKLIESDLSDTVKILPDNRESNIDTIDKEVTGVVDGVLVITDPDITSSEYEEVIERANEIIEGTPDGKLPFIEDYLGQYIQTCPICGKTFVSKALLGEGDTCPLCLEQPQNFVTVGKIESEEEQAEREEIEAKINEEERKEDEIDAVENDVVEEDEIENETEE